MAKESLQKRLSRDRAPRVQITYDVEVGDAIETKEIPFVLGAMGDYVGHSKEPLPKLKDRKFVQIDNENFDDVIKGMAPRLNVRVDNHLKNDDSQLTLELNFSKLEDFEPQNVLAQVDPLAQLLEMRTRLADLRNKIAGNDKLEELLNEVVHDTEKLRSISQAQSRESES